MILATPPFNRDDFFHYKQYAEARQQFLEEQYVGKTVTFAHDLIGISGAIRHKKGDTAEVIAINCECFKLAGIDGTIFKPSAFL
jgi:hypothetical protein